MPAKAKSMMDRLIQLSQDATFRLETEPTSTMEYVSLLTFLDEIQSQVSNTCTHVLHVFTVQ